MLVTVAEHVKYTQNKLILNNYKTMINNVLTKNAIK